MTPFLQEGDHNLIMSRIDKSSDNTFIYRSKVMDEVMKLTNKIAITNSSILIVGQAGAGKNCLAKYIHNRSQVALGPFVTIHCGSLNSKVFENELFGTQGDEYSQSTEGAIRLADGGTILLDEVTKMPESVIKKFKEFLKSRVVVSAGAERGVPVNVRIMYSTSCESEITNGKFDKDLYTHMNPLRIEIPNLCDRKEDIPDLVRHFLNKNLVKSTESPRVSKYNITEQAVNVLKCYMWPRNLKELKNLCEHFQLFCTNGNITIKDIPAQILDTDGDSTQLSYDPSLTLSDINRIYILNALKHYPSKKRAAQALGITVKTLYNRLHEYGMFDRYAIHSKS